MLEFFQDHRRDLSEISRARLDSGRVLRILDSKEIEDQVILERDEFPNFNENLSNESRERFHNLQEGLSTLGIYYQIDSKLVRGLDYYDHSVWEYFIEPQESGAANRLAVIAGGRYDNLAKELGGPHNIPSAG